MVFNGVFVSFSVYGSILFDVLCIDCVNPSFLHFFQPPKIKSFINSVTAVPLDQIHEPLACFRWEFDKVISNPVCEPVFFLFCLLSF